MLRKLLDQAPTEAPAIGIGDLAPLGRKVDLFHRLAEKVAGMEMQDAARKGVKPAELLALKSGQLSEIGLGRLEELTGLLAKAS